MSKLPITRAEAKAVGSPRYNTGKPCKHGHVADRFTSSGTCSECLAPRRREGMRKWAAENPEEKKRRAAEWYDKNRDEIIERVRENYYADIDKSRERAREYAASHKKEARQRAKKWAIDNPDRKKQSNIAWTEANRDRSNSLKAKYRAAKRQACPPWLNKEMLDQIHEIYRLRRQISEATGIVHEVDHIVPLQGGTVCGLHVPWNLRVITKEKNNRRPRLWKPA